MSVLLLAPLRTEHAALRAGLRTGPGKVAGCTGRGLSAGPRTGALRGAGAHASPGPHVPAVHLRRTGMGQAGSAAALARLAAELPWPGAVLVAGVGGGLAEHVRPGDVVVATQVWSPDGPAVPVPSAPLLTLALRWAGLVVHAGPVLTCARVVDGGRRAELATTGALCADTESSHLAAAAAPGCFAVVRVVVDTAEHPLRSPGTAVRGLAALRGLRRAAPVLARWAAGVAPATAPPEPTPVRPDDPSPTGSTTRKA